MPKPSPQQKQFMREATTQYHESLESSPAHRYLQARGLAEATNFRLGFVKNPLAGHETYRGFLAIPYLRRTHDNQWSVISIRFRCIQDHEHTGHGKYMTVAGETPHLFNTAALLKPGPAVAITEGELDAITAQQCGIPTVGVPGSQAWQPHFCELFLGYREVYVLADGDAAGTQFANTVAGSLPNAKVIPMPAGHDVNSLVTTQGKQALIERMK
jgi:DNA primase